MEPRRRVVAVLTVAAFVLIGVGVVAVVFDSGFVVGGVATGSARTTVPQPSSPSTSASATARPTEPRDSGASSTPEPSASATPVASVGPSERTTGFIQQGDAFVYYAPDGSTIPVMPVPGLEVQIQSGKAIYYALASNRYGLKTGSYAGQFMPLVTMGQADGSSAETGGIVLAGPVVLKMISDELASIKSDSDRWIVAFPVYFRPSTASMVDVSFYLFGLAGWSNTPRVVVRFSGSLPVVETIPTNGGFHVLVEQIGVTAWQVIDPVRLSLPPGAIDSAHAMNQLLLYGDGTPAIPGAKVPRDTLVDGAVAVGTPMLTATSDVSVSLVVNGSRADLGPDKILSVGDVPVFVASSS